MKTAGRKGFTLIELLIVITIIGIMAGIALPVIQSSRGAARRLICTSNLRSLAQGITNYETTNQKYPKAATFEEYPNANPYDCSTSIIYKVITNPGSVTAADQKRYLSNWVVDLLPYLDQKEVSNSWNPSEPFFSTVTVNPSIPPNSSISSKVISILTCPDDHTAAPNAPNLTYVVNGGFSRWHAYPQPWTAPANDADPTGGPGDNGPSKKGDPLGWVPSPKTNWLANQNVAVKMGMMFMGTRLPGPPGTTWPWNYQTTNQKIVDGQSTTLLMTENTLAGASPGTIYSGNVATNWASPFPTFCMFFGPDAVCIPTAGGAGCLGGQLQPIAGTSDGPGWALANKSGTNANINFANSAVLTTQGSFPYPSSDHGTGVNAAFCDGSVKYLTSTIDGTVYAKIITPAGSQLPNLIRQLPLSQNDIDQ